WTIKEDLRKRIEAFEIRTFRRMLAISWTLKVSNEEVLRRVNQRRELLHTIKIRKVAYLGHVLRHERYGLLQLITMGKVAGRSPGFVIPESGLESRVHQNYFASRKIDKNLRSSLPTFASRRGTARRRPTHIGAAWWVYALQLSYDRSVPSTLAYKI
ncbi:jg7888, partial [Pararge aegeria aegeria]